MSNNLVVSTGAADRVPLEINTFQSSAWDAISNARQALNDMYLNRPNIPDSAAEPGNIPSTNITYNPPYPKPVWDFTFNPPEWNVKDPILKPVIKTEVEDFTGSPPVSVSPSIPVRPNPSSPTAPGDAPTITDAVIPDAPILDSLSDPKEWAITIPVAPIVDIPPFYAPRPDSRGISKPGSSFSWSEDPYTSKTLDDVIALVAQFSDGGVGIPDAVWEALWAKENDRENRAGEKLVDEVNQEWSSRGFQLPQGVQVAQVQEVYQNLQNTSAGRSRDIAIRESDLAIENLRFAVQQGIALENMRGSWYQATIARALEATKYASELAVSVFNAEVSFYNSQVQMYLADVQVYKAEIEAELARLDVYKSELEGQKIIGDLNLQQVQMYSERVKALNLEIDQYNAILSGIKITTEVDAVRIEGYKAEVQAYGESIKAINLEYTGYATAMQGAKVEAEIYDTNVKAFASTVQAYATKVDAEVKNTGIDIEINKYLLEEYNLRIKGFVSELEAEVKNLQAASEANSAETKVYIAQIDSEKVSVQAQSVKYNADIQAAAQVTQANISNATNNAKNALAEAQLVQSGLESIANVEAAYAGSALSAVNLSASMGDTASNSASA